jgi:hypothetical protein
LVVLPLGERALESKKEIVLPFLGHWRGALLIVDCTNRSYTA